MTLGTMIFFAVVAAIVAGGTCGVVAIWRGTSMFTDVSDRQYRQLLTESEATHQMVISELGEVRERLTAIEKLLRSVDE
ncbi:MAG: hypothetical protein ACJ73S_30365 [Mycobacteriales bacterium]|jgi:hypothetical protein